MHQYGREYFEGGNTDGSGYKGFWYQNFPAQEIVVRKILQRKPESVLDLGAAKGYHVRMLEQRGVRAAGVDISEYCIATRVSPNVFHCDVENDGLPFETQSFDLAFSIAMFEHLDEDKLEHVILEMSRVCKRGLICPSFTDVGDPDHSHRSLHPKEWWEAKFKEVAPGFPVEIVDKEEMENKEGIIAFGQPVQLTNGLVLGGEFINQDFATLFGDNDRKVLLNIGSWMNQYRSTESCCIINMDIADLRQYAMQMGYNFKVHDASKGKLPMPTGSVDAIVISHMLEHLTRAEGLHLLKECNRVLKPGGIIRIAVPNLRNLIDQFEHGSIKKLHSIYNPDIEKAADEAEAFWHALTGNHKTAYDASALYSTLHNAGFAAPSVRVFCDSESELILNNTFDMYPLMSLYVDATARGISKSVVPKKPKVHLNMEIEGKMTV